MKPEDGKIFTGLSDDSLMALTVWGEARGEKDVGKMAVACVLKNRHDLWKQTYNKVCLGKNQFSGFISTDPNYPKLKSLAQSILMGTVNDKYYNDCLIAVCSVLGPSCTISVENATFYRVIGCKNSWFDGQVNSGNLIKVKTIGRHEFYAEKKYLK